MAVAPLFNASMDSLLKRVRMSSADDEDTLALIDQTVSEVRLGFFRRIGTARALTVASYTLADNPTTDNEILRVGAANTEALWVTMLLIQRLPNLFMDNRASTRDAWNDEQLTRDSSGQSQYLKYLQAQVDEGVVALTDPSTADSSGSPKASLIKASEPNLVFENFAGLYPTGLSNPRAGYL